MKQTASTEYTMKAKQKNKKAYKKLLRTAIVCAFFMIIELIGGYMANSIAIMSDAAHMLSDFSGFMLSLFSIWFAQRPVSDNMSYGYYRAEVIGALSNLIIIWGLTIWLISEAIERVMRPCHINTSIMLISSLIGILFNFIMGFCLHTHKKRSSFTNQQENKGKSIEIVTTVDNTQRADPIPAIGSISKEDIAKKEETIEIIQNQKQKEVNVNLRVAMIHVFGDFIQSVGILIAAIIIYYKPELIIFDPICTFLFSIIVFFTTVPLAKECLHVLMEGTPQEINLLRLQSELLAVFFILSNF